jgi:hypothetical protein
MSNQIRIPASQIVSGSYTANGEYVYKGNTKKIYKGYYYKYKDKFYTGKTFDPSIATEELIPAKKVTYTSKNFLYDVLAGIKQGAVTPVNSTPVKNRTAVLASIQQANQQGFTKEVGVNNDADINAINAYGESQVASSTTTQRKRYFYRQMYSLNKVDAYKFGEIKTEDDYDLLTKRPNYVTAIITETKIPGQAPFFDEKELNDANDKMPGLKKFLENQPQTPAETIATPASTTPPPPPSSTTTNPPASTGGGGSTSSSGGSGGRMIVTGTGNNSNASSNSRIK